MVVKCLVGRGGWGCTVVAVGAINQQRVLIGWFVSRGVNTLF